MIAYLRDIVMDYSFIAESFGTNSFPLSLPSPPLSPPSCITSDLQLILCAETSVSYKDALKLCDSVKKKIKDSCLSLGVCAPPFVCCRITQVLLIPTYNHQSHLSRFLTSRSRISYPSHLNL